jgi:1-aminocyclopropane-1-carboxylate deaminase/D-cysteine desulfhydrase-like pyridoxal-dependent ACC family enzyme
VAISTPTLAVIALGHHFATHCARAVGASGAGARKRLSIDGGWLGRGYGYATPEGEAALRRAEGFGLTLDPTYTAKAFACALSRARELPDERVLYWHTLSSAPMGPFLEAAPPLPPKLGRLFR